VLPLRKKLKNATEQSKNTLLLDEAAKKRTKTIDNFFVTVWRTCQNTKS
jgi:hypothetical protein